MYVPAGSEKVPSCVLFPEMKLPSWMTLRCGVAAIKLLPETAAAGVDVVTRGCGGRGGVRQSQLAGHTHLEVCLWKKECCPAPLASLVES